MSEYRHLQSRWHLDRRHRHLQCAADDLPRAIRRLGRSLHFDAATYSCVGDAEANRMFRRNYRKPFVVPEKV